jgi:ABC-type phosphate transport system substrate-binding protein
MVSPIRSAKPASAVIALALVGACTSLESASDILESESTIERDAGAESPVSTPEEDASDVEAPAPSDAATTSDKDAGAATIPATDARAPTTDAGSEAPACSGFDNRLVTRFKAGSPLPTAPTPAAASDAGTPAPDAAASADPLCAELATRGTVVYVTGSTAAKPFLNLLGPQLASRGVYMVYTASGSCTGVDAVLNGTAMRTGAAPLPAAATFWDGPASTGASCQLPPDGVTADIGVSDVFAQTCAGFELANLDNLRVRDAHGPVQTMNFVVPASSKHTAISAEAAYFVFGFGATAGVVDEAGNPTWNDENLLFRRNASSGTQALLAAAIGLPSPLWKGRENANSDEVAKGLLGSAGTEATASAALGILSDDYLQIRNLRSQLRVLAFQDAKQTCAVFPDSTLTARDKRNVRDGAYPLWGPMHLLHRVDAEGKPARTESRSAVTDILGYFAGTKALPNGVQLIDVYAESGLIPECAMHVTRSSDGGKISKSAPDFPCSCLFEAKAMGSTSCKACRVQGDCASGETCALGYCEATP